MASPEWVSWRLNCQAAKITSTFPKTMRPTAALPTIAVGYHSKAQGNPLAPTLVPSLSLPPRPWPPLHQPQLDLGTCSGASPLMNLDGLANPPIQS
jgi:hypothetical protein